MRKFHVLFHSALIVILLSSCRGYDGAPGPRGPQGPPGPRGDEAYVFEYENVDFNAVANFEVFLDLPNDFQMLNSDKLLVYFLWDYIPSLDLDVWRMLPQTLFVDSGTVQYNYDFTKVDARLFMNGNFDLNLLDSAYTQNWIVRLVVIPGQFGKTQTGERFDDYNELERKYQLNGKKHRIIRNRPVYYHEPAKYSISKNC